MKVGIYARVSTQEQQTLPLQIKDLREFARRRKWKIEIEISDVASGAKTRPKREELLRLEGSEKLIAFSRGDSTGLVVRLQI